MKISDLKIKRTEIATSLKVIRDLAIKEDRVLTDDESKNVAELTRNLTNVEASLSLAGQDLNIVRMLSPETIVPQVVKPKTELELIRQLVTAGRQTDDILEVNRTVAEKVDTQGIFISRGFTNATDGANLSPVGVSNLTITESPVTPALYKRMGLTVYPSLNGGTQKLPYMSTLVAEQVAEGVDITQTDAATNHVELSPTRVGIQIAVTREGLATYNQATWDGIMRNVIDAVDRKITAKVYAAVYAGATTVAAVTALTKANFDLLEGSVPIDGKYLMSRKTFYATKAVAIDTGSGKFLANRVSQDFGETYEGTEIFHSGLFVDATKTKYVLYGAMANIAIGFWGADAYEIIVDPYSGALGGSLLITVSKLVDIQIPDAAIAFVKSADLDPTS